VKDLLTKKYSSKSFEFTSKYPSGVTAETTLSIDAKGAVDSSLNIKGKGPLTGGDLEGEFGANGKHKATLKLSKLSDFFTVKLGLNGSVHKEKAFKDSPYASVNVDYSKTVSSANVKVSTTVNHNLERATVDVNGVVGQDGLATGGFAKLALSKEALQGSPKDLVTDVGLGVQYTSPEYTVGMTSSNFWDKLSLSHYINYSKDYQLGSQFDWIISKSAATVSVGSNFKVDSNTVFKSKAVVGDDENKKPVFTASAYLERSLSSQLSVGATTELNLLSATPFAPTGFGISVNLGN